jgi:hypothetical protein
MPNWQAARIALRLRNEFGPGAPIAPLHLACALHVIGSEYEALVANPPAVLRARAFLIRQLIELATHYGIRASATQNSHFVDLVRIAYAAAGLDAQSHRADVRRYLNGVQDSAA